MKLSNYIKNCEVKFDPSENIAKKIEDEIVKPFAIRAAIEFDKFVLDEVNNTYRAIYKTSIKIDKEQFIKDVEDLKIYRAKETPKKVKGLSVTYEGRVANCPSCNQFIIEEEYFKRCPECCQKLDWSGDK